jgi:hypothetical protein
MINSNKSQPREPITCFATSLERPKGMVTKQGGNNHPNCLDNNKAEDNKEGSSPDTRPGAFSQPGPGAASSVESVTSDLTGTHLMDEEQGLPSNTRSVIDPGEEPPMIEATLVVKEDTTKVPSRYVQAPLAQVLTTFDKNDHHILAPHAATRKKALLVYTLIWCVVVGGLVVAVVIFAYQKGGGQATTDDEQVVNSGNDEN